MKTTPCSSEMKIQMPEEAAAKSSATDLAAEKQRRFEAAAAALRAACLMSSVVALSLMVSSEQKGNLNIFGLQIPLHSNWSYSDSLEYVVGVTAAATAHSLLQLLLIARSKVVEKGPTVTSRGHAWILFVADQAFAYAMISAGSAAAGVTNLNQTGIRHSALPNLCKPLPRFCNFMAISIAFAFLSFLFLATSAVLDVLWLANY